MNERHSLPQAREVCPTTTRRLIEKGALLVDVREPDEIAAQAFDVPEIMTIPLGQLPARFAEIPRDRDLIMVCKGGGRSLKATHFLMNQGYERVANMEGGIMSWASKGFPVKGQAGSVAQGNQNTSSCCSSEATTAASSGCCNSAAPKSSCC